MKKGKNNIVLIVFYFACFIIVSGCMSRYGADDQYSYDGTYYIPSAGWYARMVDITGEKHKTLYLSKDPLMIEQPLDSMDGPVILINKLHDYPSMLISQDSIIIGVESFRILGDTTLCRKLKSATIMEVYLSPDRETAKEMVDNYSRILPKYPYSLLVFETWRNSIRLVPNMEYLKMDSSILQHRIEPLHETASSFREQNIKPAPLWLIRMKERHKKR